MDNKEFKDLVYNFMERFEIVFDNDWSFTKEMLNDEEFLSNFIEPNEGSFLQPKVDDEHNNWANRGNLLDAYRKLKAFMKERK